MESRRRCKGAHLAKRNPGARQSCRRQHGACGQSVRDLERCVGEGDGEGAARSARLSGRDRIEAEMLSGDSVRDPADAAFALSKIGGRIKSVIVTLGGQGLVIKFAEDTISTSSAKRVNLVSSHGAGDCFVGACGESR